MKSKNKLIEQLKGALEENRVLTDLEDRYVYSFEKIFMEQPHPMPDVVVRVSSSEEVEDVSRLAEREDILLVERGKQYPHIPKGSSKLLILLDNSKIPSLGNTIKKGKKKDEIIANLHKLRKTGYGTYRNLALGLKSVFLNKSFNKCLESTICSGYCTVASSFDGIETWSSKGRMLLIKGVMKGELNLSKKVIDSLYSCTKCGLCFAQCFQELDLQEAIIATRRHIAEKNMVPQAFQAATKNIFDYGDPGAVPIERRLSWMKKISNSRIPDEAENLYWVGCMVANRTPKTAKAFFNILSRASMDFTMLAEKEGCCGYVLFSAGLWDEAKKVADTAIEKIEKTKAEALITPCAGCYYTFTKLYPETLDVSVPIEIHHTSQFLEKMIKQGDITLKALNEPVTYHDPCSLGRHSKVFEAPRNVLRAIPKLKFIEMHLNRERARCCGGGGGLWTFNHRVSMDTARTRLKEDLVPINVNTLTTACPQCQMNFQFVSKKSSPLKIYDITEIIERVMVAEN
ncbi:MAG: heterodisulfide reductase-related iron-sulfur binding cluster [Candidatus Hodarchaeota archaeon]